MTFAVSGLSPAPFRHLFGLSDQQLEAHKAMRCIVDASPGYPERIELRDAEIGESLLLVNYMHQPANTPFQSGYAIYVREGAQAPSRVVGKVPDVLLRRAISLRAFDRSGMLIDAALAEGNEIQDSIQLLLSNPRASYLHAHYAKFGCYAARVDRA